MKTRTLTIAAFIAALAMNPASAPLPGGIAPYPQSSTNGMDGVEKALKAQGYKTMTCRRTPDGVPKVKAFYGRDPRLKPMGNGIDGFTAPDGFSLTMQHPWLDLATGQMQSDTLICVGRAR